MKKSNRILIVSCCLGVVVGTVLPSVASADPEVIRFCEYMPLAVGNVWGSNGTGNDNVLWFSVTDTFSVNGYTAWKIKTVYGFGVDLWDYVVQVDDWFYITTDRADLDALPAITGSMVTWFPEYISIGEPLTLSANQFLGYGDLVTPLVMTRDGEGSPLDILFVADEDNCFELRRNLGWLLYEKENNGWFFTITNIVGGGCKVTVDCALMTAWIDSEWPLMASDLGLNDNLPAAPGENVPERWGLASVLAVVCNERHPHYPATMSAFAANLATLESEPAAVLDRVGPYKRVLAAILLINANRRDYFAGLLGLQGYYEVVHGGAKAPGEPFSDEGDLDGDGVTNGAEYQEVVAVGGTYEDYVQAAAGPDLNGMPLAGPPLALALLAAGFVALRARRWRVER